MLNTIFKDFALLLAMSFLAMVIMLVQFINDPSTSDGKIPPGNIVVSITWPQGDIDVDLWVLGPGELRPVGYSNVNGLLFNLLRDDQGDQPDLTSLNYENAYSRGTPAGEYIVNLHCYGCENGPVDVEVEVSKRAVDIAGGKNGIKPIAYTKVNLLGDGDEQTAVRFYLGPDGELVPGTLNHLYEPLRSAR